MDHSPVPFGIEHFPALVEVSFFDVEPCFRGQSLNLGVFLIEFLELEEVERVVLSPEVGNVSASPHPDAVNGIGSLLSVNSEIGKAVFSKVIVKVSQITVHQVVGQVADLSLTFVDDVIHLPKRPSFMVELGPEFGKTCFHVWSVEELSLPVIDVERRLGQKVKGVDFLGISEIISILSLIFLLLLLFLLGLFLLLLLLSLSFLLIVLLFLLLLLLLNNLKLGKGLFDAKPGLSKEF